jgi:hypothetical protein
VCREGWFSLIRDPFDPEPCELSIAERQKGARTRARRSPAAWAKRHPRSEPARTEVLQNVCSLRNFREQVQADSQPKLSIHVSGQVHIYANDEPKAGPIQIPPPTELRGEHVASVRFDSIASVPEFRGKPRIEGEEIDYAFGVPPDVKSGVLLVYANGVANSCRTEHVQLGIQAQRFSQAIPSLSRSSPPLYRIALR